MDSTKPLEPLLNHVADQPVLLARLAQVLLTKGHAERARELCARAVALAPDDGEVRALAAEVFSHGIGGWYFSMVQDQARHAAYDKALRRIVRPGHRVLEIGTGTGLFAMMAARAGAAEVTTCECNPVVAAAAAEIIARNGFADRVRVIVKNSADLEVGVDLPDRADLLVWDNLANNMIGSGALPAVETAVRRLLRPGAPVMPARGTICVALAEDKQAGRGQMHLVEGFDLSRFNRLAAPAFVTRAGHERIVLRSEPTDLFSFDFQSGGPFPQARSTVLVSSTGGPVNGIAQWVRFQLDDEGWYENHPSTAAMSTFGIVFHPLGRTVEMMPGAQLTIGGAHDRQSLRIWADGPVEQ